MNSEQGSQNSEVSIFVISLAITVCSHYPFNFAWKEKSPFIGIKYFIDK